MNYIPLLSVKKKLSINSEIAEIFKKPNGSLRFQKFYLNSLDLKFL